MLGIAVSEEEKNYYEVLEVPTDSKEADIDKAYKRAKNAYTQDSVALYSIMSDDECSQMLDCIEEAYTILGDPVKRRMYDEARGINIGNPILPESIRPALQTHLEQQKESQNGADTAAIPINKVNINKIVASKKFSLDFIENPEMEKEIEQATQFSGKFLKRIREYKNVDMVRMADMTKVSKTYLLNIEEEAVKKLPALVYVRGFVYQYAKCLKLSPDLVATSYLHRLKKRKEESA